MATRECSDAPALLMQQRTATSEACTDASALLTQQLLKRLQRCGDISAECCQAGCELLCGAPLRSLRAEPLRDGEAPLAFWRHSRDGAAALLVLLDLHGTAGPVALHPAPDLLNSLDDATHFRAHRQRTTASRPSGAPQRSAPRAEPLEWGEWGECATYSLEELRHGQLLATAPAHGLLCLRLEPVPRPASTAAAAAAAREHLLSSALRLACRPPEASARNGAAVLLRQLMADRADATAGLGALWRRLQPVPRALLPSFGCLLGAALHMALAAPAPAEDCGGGGGGGGGGRGAAAAACGGRGAEAAARPSFEVAARLLQRTLAAATRLARPAAAPPPSGPEARGRGEGVASPTEVEADLGAMAEAELEAALAAEAAEALLASGAAGAAEAAGAAGLRSVCAWLRERTCEGVVVLVAPEVGPLCTVGGLGVMVQQLSAALAAHGRVAVIAPAYETCAAQWAHAAPLCVLPVPLGARRVPVRVLRVPREANVDVYLLRAPAHFGAPYARAATPWARLEPAVLLPRAALLLLHWLQTQPPADGGGRPFAPSAVISNDWVAALTAPYARHTQWALGCGGDAGDAAGAAAELQQAWADVPFVHLVHNLEEGYDGAIELRRDCPLGGLHLLPSHLLHEAGGQAVHLSRAALLCAHNWATVSEGYRAQLLGGGTRLAPLLRSFGAPFACASGIPLAARRALLAPHGGHAAAKAALQRRCFGEAGVRAVPLLAFVGRIASQKGVHLLLDVLPALLRGCGGAVQLLVCGQADGADPYARQCAAQMRALRAAHPLHFWAQPEVWCDAGPLVTAGADFGLMPSLFEPCGSAAGLVREEFFAAGTPLVCSRTGGLADRVRHYAADPDEPHGASSSSAAAGGGGGGDGGGGGGGGGGGLRAGGEGGEGGEGGNGLFIEEHTHQALLAALQRALRLYAAPHHYAALRRNAHASACDVTGTAWRWRAELRRLRTCLVLRQLGGAAALQLRDAVHAPRPSQPVEGKAAAGLRPASEAEPPPPPPPPLAEARPV